MSMSDGFLFGEFEIYAVVESQKLEVKKKIQSIPSATVLGASETDLLQSLFDEFKLNVPVLLEEDIYIATSGETQVDVSRDPMRMIPDPSRPFYVPGNKTIIAVPFDGDATFFRVRPQSYSLSPPRAMVARSELLLTFVTTNPDANAIKRGYQETVRSVKQYLQSLEESAKLFNEALQGLIASHLKARKDRLLADAGMTAAIGLPLKRREGIPVTYAVPVSRRAPRIEQISIKGSFTPEPTLAREDYEEILGIMKNMVQVMELSPNAFLTIGEEDLRFHFLVHLNGAFKGQATGETFNVQGKTDILIRVDGKNVFIAECKFWKGETGFLETIDQLLSYLSWRDTKVAVLIFNRNANFSAVLSKIAEVTPKHRDFKRDLGRSDETTFRYIFAQSSDPNREVTLTVLAFDIPTSIASTSG